MERSTVLIPKLEKRQNNNRFLNLVTTIHFVWLMMMMKMTMMYILKTHSLECTVWLVNAGTQTEVVTTFIRHTRTIIGL